ncbi:MAG: type II secretion system protein N [Pseudomonadota bacterium]
MKRLPEISTFAAVLALSASLTYWGMEMYKPKERPLAVAEQAAVAEPSPEAAAGLFGGQPASTASNYQLTGVIAAGRDSAAIIIADGKPAQAIKIGKDVVPGVTVVEVHPRYVMLSENGMRKRVEITADTRPAVSMGGVIEAPGQAQMQNQQPADQQMNRQQSQQPIAQGSEQPPQLVEAPPPTPTPPPPPQVEMPPPTRAVGVSPPTE